MSKSSERRRPAKAAGARTKGIPQVLAERYEIVRRVGTGGMADVYLAEDTQLGRQVALKILHSQYARDEAFVERFRREAHAAANLQHANIVQIYDWGREGDFNFIVMEYVEGRTLKDVIASDAPLPTGEAVRIAGETLAALAYAHRHGLVHRDIKPGNILLSDDGEVAVTDFGIARAEAGTSMTQTGTILGTAYYLSPEQAQGHQLDGRSDIYSTGVVLYEMLTGQRPFEGESPVAIAYKHVREMPRPPSHHTPNMPRPLEAIVLTALAKKPEDRYSSAALMRRDLEAFTGGREVTATIKATRVEDSTAVLRPVGILDRQAAKRPGWLVALALLLLGGGLALGTWSLVSLFSTVVGRVEVPNVRALSAQQAQILLRQVGLDPSFQGNEASETLSVGLVTRQEPLPQRQIARGSEVKYWVSSGPAVVEIPDVVGETLDAARRLLEREGLGVGRIVRENSSAPKDTVTEQNPRAGGTVSTGDTVDLTVSAGEQLVGVPDVVGLSEAQAATTLANSGLRVHRVSEPNDEFAAGIVFGQDPQPSKQDGTQNEVPTGSTVTIFVSQGPNQFPMPDVRGRSEADATAILESRGLVVRSFTQFTPDPTQRGNVVAQDPESGSTVSRGQSVTIYIGSD